MVLWHLRRRTDVELTALLANCRTDSLTYAPVGISLDVDGSAAGLVRRSWQRRLDGDGVYERAVQAISDWSVHRGAGLAVQADGPLGVGTNVALEAPLPVGFVIATCRVTAVVKEADRFGFAYGTLPTHPERGEESFVVSRGRGVVEFRITAISKPAHPLAKAVPPVADQLQQQATQRYLRAMVDAVRTAAP